MYGFISYDSALTNKSKSHIDVPGFYFCKFKSVILFDHLEHKLVISENDKASRDLLVQTQEKSLSREINLINKFSRARSNFSDESYKAAIKEIKKKIFNGDFYEANLTRKFFGECNVQNSFQIYRDILNVNQVPYGAYAKLKDFEIISFSPERFIKLSDGIVTSRPIKGTISVGKKLEDTLKNQEILKHSVKNRAENLMIVDLMRNDFSKNCIPNTVNVKNLFETEIYKNVIHMYSDIEGELKGEFIDCLSDAFPPGSMTGAPKKIAIEVCDEIENYSRGLYSGCLGYYHPRYADFSVMIRTLVIKKNQYEIQVGGAIVADSDPDDELSEIYAKFKPFKNFIETC